MSLNQKEIEAAKSATYFHSAFWGELIEDKESL